MFPILLFCSLFCFFNCKISIFFNSCRCFLLFLSLNSFFENELLLSSMVVREFLSFPWTEFLPMELISQKDFLLYFFYLSFSQIAPHPSLPSSCGALSWPAPETSACQISTNSSRSVSTTSLIMLFMILWE